MPLNRARAAGVLAALLVVAGARDDERSAEGVCRASPQGGEGPAEALRQQQGIAYFVTGSGGQLREGNIDKRSGITAAGFDTDQAWFAVEIDGDRMYFMAVSRRGQTVDSGVLSRRMPVH